MAEPNALTKHLAFDGIPAQFRSLDDQISQLVRQYGADAVREATKRHARKRAGRKQEKDFVLLADWFKQDAVDWLDDRDPFEQRSNYAMAMHVAEQVPPHKRASTHRRLMRKLASRRRSIFLVTAWEIAGRSRPFGDYFRACNALVELDVAFASSVQWMADNVRGKIERYKEQFGEIDPTLTIPDIDEALKPKPLPSLDRSIAGLLGSMKG
jgi:hypothetical protein